MSAEPIGGTSAAARNIISGNGQASNFSGGLYIIGSGTSANLVEGNYIGTDVNGTANLGNAWTGVGYLTPAATWGAFPGHSRNDIQSGIGVVHNAFLIDRPERTVVYRHALRNALVPVLTVIGLQFGSLLAGAIVTETIFSWPGIGRLTLSAISNRDYALVQGCILAVGLTYVAVNLLTEVAYTIANPRMRSS